MALGDHCMMMSLPDDCNVRLETTVNMKIGEVKNLANVLGNRITDISVKVMLDHEELYRTAIIEKSLNPLIGEQFNFLVPRQFSKLTFYVCDEENVSKDCRIGHVTFTRNQLSFNHEFPNEQWYPLNAVSHDSEVQGKLNVSVSISEQLDGVTTYPVLHIKVSEAAGLAAWSSNGPFSDPYCMVTLYDTNGIQKSDIRRGIVRKRTLNPIFGDIYRFKLSRFEDIKDIVIRISLWHQQMLGDVFLGQVHLSLSSIDPYVGHAHEAWYSLCPRTDYVPTNTGSSIRLLVLYHEDYILPTVMYQPLRLHLLNSITDQCCFVDTALSILHDICKDRSAMGRSTVKLFLQLNKVRIKSIR
jgi:Ca2+-dependent lipid-binding protein